MTKEEIKLQLVAMTTQELKNKEAELLHKRSNTKTITVVADLNVKLVILRTILRVRAIGENDLN